jgi:glucokinase
MINLPCVLKEDELAAELGFPVELLNDLHATANAVPHLGRDDLLVLNEGTAVPGGTIAVIAPGTGLGEAFLTWDGTRYRPHASEGGHADFAPRNLLETELFGYIHARLDHVSYERICSGPGIFNIYSFLRDRGCGNEPQFITEALQDAQDPAPVIVSAAMDPERRCELCERTVRVFVSVLAAEAGNLALKVKATGGIYIAGGIPPRILPYLEEKQFLETLQNKGRESFLVAAMPVKVVLNPEAALLGAALAALEKCRDGEHLPL